MFPRNGVILLIINRVDKVNQPPWCFHVEFSSVNPLPIALSKGKRIALSKGKRLKNQLLNSLQWPIYFINRFDN